MIFPRHFRVPLSLVPGRVAPRGIPVDLPTRIYRLETLAGVIRLRVVRQWTRVRGKGWSTSAMPSTLLVLGALLFRRVPCLTKFTKLPVNLKIFQIYSMYSPSFGRYHDLRVISLFWNAPLTILAFY